MKKALLFIFLASGITSFCQPPGGGLGNLQGLKIAYITRQLNLTSEEAQKFWPIYYNFADELSAIRKENAEDVIGLDEKVLALKKRYWIEFKKVLGTDERVNKGFLAERDFGNYIKKELELRQKIREQKQQNKPR